MSLRHISILSALVCVPSVALSDDSFIYTRENAPKMVVGVPDTANATAQYYEQVEQAQQEQRQQGQLQREQMQKNNNQYYPARGETQNYAQQNTNIPETPAGWDSLTTGTANGGGVLGGGQGGYNGVGGINSNTTGLLGGNANSRIMNSGLPQNILSSLSVQDASGGILGGSVEESDGVSSARERAMYGAFLNSLLQFVQSQPDTAPIASVGSSYGAAQAYTMAPAHSATRSAVASRSAAAVTVPARGNTQTPQPWK